MANRKVTGDAGWSQLMLAYSFKAPRELAASAVARKGLRRLTRAKPWK